MDSTMSKPSLEEVIALAATGRCQAALRGLDQVWTGRTAQDPEVLILRAELLNRIGLSKPSAELSATVLKTFPSHTPIVARALTVLGLIAFQDGLATRATELLSAAERVAKTTGDARDLVLPGLAALGTAADHWERPRLTAFISQLKRDVLNCGEPRCLARLHHYLARYDAFEANFGGAERHLLAAARLNAVDEDLSLTARILHTQANIALIKSELDAALTLERSVLKLAVECGEANLILSAQGNLGFICLSLGQLAEADVFLRRTIESDALDVYGRHATLHNLADLALAKGNVRSAVAKLDEAKDLIAAGLDGPRSSYHIGTCVTRFRLLAHEGRWVEAEEAASDGLTASQDRSDTANAFLFGVLKAEAMLGQGLDGGAESMLTGLTGSGSSTSPLGRAHFERVIGSLLRSSGRHDFAADHFERAAAIGRSIGSAWLAYRLTSDWCRTLVEHESDEPSLEELGNIASVTTVCPDQCSRLGSPGASAFATERTVAALLDGEYNVPLFAEQVGFLLVDSQAAEGVVVASRADRRPPIAHLFAGWDYQTAVARVTTPHDAIVVDVGKHAGRQYRVVVQPKPALEAHLAVTAITRIAAAALALEAYRRDEKERGSLWPFDATGGDEGEVFASDEMVEMVATARRLAPTDIPVLLSGETGTGKEVIARLVHRTSRRASKPFLAFNCTAVPRDMLDSQLFGYRRGAFTGATEAFPGVIRAAAGGTLLLDEIGELGPDLQPKLLRFLERQEILPLGETTPARVDVRIVAATNADLDALVSEGRFRADLLYRLNGVHLHLPPLRKRREEIPLFVHRFLQRYGEELKRGRPRVSEETMEYLLLYAWPGNVRQLANEIRRAVALVDADGTITPDCLSADLRASRRTIPANAPPDDDAITVRVNQPLTTAIEQVERLMISRALEGSNGNLEEAARRLGLSRKGLFLKRRRLGLDPPNSGRDRASR
jgi:transcriptional regulator with PAS, ATPase and Fis domain/tetratricopeptide (TPR) repeat protein